MNFRVLILLVMAVCSVPHVARSGGLAVYPDGDLCRNPRVPMAEPRDGFGANGSKGMNLSVPFTYDVAPWVAFTQGGKLECALRSLPSRREKTLLRLNTPDGALTLEIGPAFDGRMLTLSAEDRKAKKTELLSLRTLPYETWSALALAWQGQKLTVSLAGTEHTVDLPLALNVAAITTVCGVVDDLALSGDGSFSLNWENGYAANVTPGASCKAAAVRLFGFDAYFVGTDPEGRDYPLIGLNGSSEATANVRFRMRGENAGKEYDWSQTVVTSGAASVFAPVEFPASPLPTDIYHLTAEVATSLPDAAAVTTQETRHFAYVQRRGEPSGGPKFGLHDSNNHKAIGFWPDALPIDYSHWYARWGYIQGPMWIKDDGVHYGLLPEVPAEEWYWTEGLEWAAQTRLIPYVCVQASAFDEWVRESEAPGYMEKAKWGAVVGGMPKDELHRRFLRELSSRYKGRVGLYEVENEPNASHGPEGKMPVAQYAEFCKRTASEIKSVDPDAKIYGPGMIGIREDWIRKIFNLGALDCFDGVSLHTYTTPGNPDDDLPGKFEELHKLIAEYGKPRPITNSETGAYTALREDVNAPISPARLQELIRQRTPGLSRPSWPFQAMTESEGASNIVRNVIHNFAAGVERFVFFGWNPHWPAPDWASRDGESCFALISADMKGERTPGLYALAMGVCTAQLEGADLSQGVRKVDAGGLVGAIFQKADGGELAVIWPRMGNLTAMLRVPSEIEEVSLLGATKRHSYSPDRPLLSLQLTSQMPVYLHAKTKGLEVLPSPAGHIRYEGKEGDALHYSFYIKNRFEQPWKPELTLHLPEGWGVKEIAELPTLAPLQVTPAACLVVPPARLAARRVQVEAELTLPDGSPCVFAIPVQVRPTLSVAKVAAIMGKLAELTLPGEPQRIERVDQAAMGAPPPLASLQEETFWKGPAELSAEVKAAAAPEGLVVTVDVTDSLLRVPEPWPGVGGSCVELFLDFRPEHQRQMANRYDTGVYQVIFRPALAEGEEPRIWHASQKYGTLKEMRVAGKRVDGKGYRLVVVVPWDAAGIKPQPSVTFGFDVSVDGPTSAGKHGRKTQLALFGTASNSTATDGFGNAVFE